jgi:uncharacterized membrane protein YvbJ
MVYCTKCGTKNPDDAKTCSQCGAPLYAVAESEQQKRVEGECFGTRRRSEPYGRIEHECFGIPRGGVVFGIVAGVIIVLFGLSLLFQQLYGTPEFWWPSVLLIFGVLIIIGAIYGMRRRS